MKSSRKPHSFCLKDIKKYIRHHINSLFFFFYEEGSLSMSKTSLVAFVSPAVFSFSLTFCVQSYIFNVCLFKQTRCGVCEYLLVSNMTVKVRHYFFFPNFYFYLNCRYEDIWPWLLYVFYFCLHNSLHVEKNKVMAKHHNYFPRWHCLHLKPQVTDLHQFFRKCYKCKLSDYSADANHIRLWHKRPNRIISPGRMFSSPSYFVGFAFLANILIVKKS